MEDISAKAGLIVGTKQVMRSASEGALSRAYVARDCDAALFTKLVLSLKKHGVETVFVPTMAELGRACGIDVGSAAAGLLKPVK